MVPRSVPPHARAAAVRAALVIALATGALAAFGTLGCSSKHRGPTAPVAVYSSIVITGPDTVLVGGNAVFTATVIDTGGNVVAAPALTWTSSDPAAATISGSGIAQGVSEGDVTIRAQGGGASSNLRGLVVFPGRGWLDQSAGLNTVLNLHGVAFTSRREGYVVGDLGFVAHTIDAGKSWATMGANSTGYTLNGIAFATPTRGVIVGSAGRALVGGRGGWSPITLDTDGGRGLNAVYFQDASRGWIVGNAGLILRTTNGGVSWTRVLPASTSVDLESVCFPRWTGVGAPPADPYGRGWAVGGAGTILGSTDFGQSWHVVAAFNDHLYGVARLDEFRAIAVGHNNRILTTFDQADTAAWQASPSSLPSPFTNLEAVAWPLQGAPPDTAWAVGKRGDTALPVVLRTDDGGDAWVDQVLPAGAPLSGNGLESVIFLDALHGWTVGAHGLVLHTATGGKP